MNNSLLSSAEILKLENFLSKLGFNFRKDFCRDIKLKTTLNVDLAYSVGNLYTIYFGFFWEFVQKKIKEKKGR